MTGFLLAGAALAVIATLAITLPLAGRRRSGSVSRRDANLAIYRDQLRELDADLAAGTLAQKDYDRSRQELESRLLADVSLEEEAEAKSSRYAPIVAAIAIPLSAAAIYFTVGMPSAVVAPGE